LTHGRTINSKYGTSDIDWFRSHVDSAARRHQGKPKFKCLVPLDEKIADRIKPLAKIIRRTAPQVKSATRLKSIEERAGRHGRWRSSLRSIELNGTTLQCDTGEQDARRNSQRPKRQTTRLAKREYFRKKNEALDQSHGGR
jgi:hypothetical protein